MKNPTKIQIFGSTHLKKKKKKKNPEIVVLYQPTNSPLTQSIKNLPTMQKTQVQSPGWEDSLEKEMATHPSILAWRIPWTEKPGGLESMGSLRVRHNLLLFFSSSYKFTF